MCVCVCFRVCVYMSFLRFSPHKMFITLQTKHVDL